MAQLNIEVNGRPYTVGCEDGQEGRLLELAAVLDTHVRQVGEQVGQLGETRLILMGALLLADDFADQGARLRAVEAELERIKGELGRVEQRTVAALESAAAKIDLIVAE
jgi:cell division protein ZapA